MMSLEMPALSAGTAKCSSRATVRIDDFPPDWQRPDLRIATARRVRRPRFCRTPASRAQQRLRTKQNASILTLAGAPEKTIQLIKTFAGLSQLGSRWPCGSRAMPLKRLIEFSAE